MRKVLLITRNIIYGKKFATKSKTKDYFLVPLYALLIAVAFRSFLFDNFHIPSGSMKGTLLIGDKITVSMFSYGYSRYSFPFGIIPFSGRIFEKNPPKQGDIIVFKFPNDKSINYVKRLIGMPGDKIRVSRGELYINGEIVKREFVDYFIDKETGREDNTPEFIVPDKHYFFMGDNRDFSMDSRFQEVGFVSEDLIIGRVERVLISSPNSLLNIFAWNKIRSERFFLKP
jgi:signal peptidase I